MASDSPIGGHSGAPIFSFYLRRLSFSKHVPLWELLWFSIVANTSIAGMNLSLMLNFVGFYQISKLSMIPVVCVMEWILHSKHYSKEVKMAVVAVVVGVGVCTVTDVKVNAKGFLCACIAVLSTSLQQIISRIPICQSFANCRQIKCAATGGNGHRELMSKDKFDSLEPFLLCMMKDVAW